MWPRVLGRPLRSLGYRGGGGVSYFIQDLFTTDRAAGAVNNTNSENGPGVRHVTDVSGTGVLITGGKIRVIGNGTFNNEGFWITPALTRAAGLVVREDFLNVTATHDGFCGVTTVQDANFTGYNNVGIVFAGGILTARRTSGATSAQLNAVSALSGSLYIVLRSLGRYIFYDAQDGSDVQMWWWDNWDNTSALYVAAMAHVNAQSADFDNLVVPSSMFYNVGILASASDSFNRANGAMNSTDGAGHTEANGGSGKSWASTLGTWGIASNKAASSALSGGTAYALVDVGTKDVIVSAEVTRASGVGGIIFRYVDANNYAIAYHDGTSVKMDEIVAGSPSTRVTLTGGNATYSAGAAVKVRILANTPATNRAMVYYNDLFIGSYGTNAAVLTGTKVGLYTTDITNTFDNFICFPSAAAYNNLRNAA